MPSPPSSPGGALFLGLEVAVDRISATVVDERAQVVEAVGVELDEVAKGMGIVTYRGVLRSHANHNPPHSGDESRQPIELIVRGIEAALDLLRPGARLGRVVAISGCAETSLVLLTAQFASTLASLSPALPLSTQFFTAIAPTSFVLPTLSIASSLSLRQPSDLAPSTSSPVQHPPQPPWRQADHVRSLGTLIASLLVGRVAGELAATVEEEWNEELYPQQELGDRLEVDDVSTVEPVSLFWRERYGLGESCILSAFTTPHLATYLSFQPSATDVVLSLGDASDALLIPTKDHRLSHHHQIYRHPAQGPGEESNTITVVKNRGGESARAYVRDLYANSSWQVLNQLVSVVAPGGSIGYDDKLFSFVSPSPPRLIEEHSHSPRRPIVRFEMGVAVEEFRDLRANPRCLIESQWLSLRTRYSSIIAWPPGSTQPAVPARTALGTGYDVFATQGMPARVLVVGSLANSPACMGVLADIFHAPVFAHAQQLNPQAPSSSAAALGAAYKAFHGHHLSFNSSSPSSSLSFSQLLSQILATPTPTAAPAAPPPLHRARSSTHSLRHAGSRSRLNDSYVAEPAALPLSPTFNPPHSRTATGSSSGIESVSTGVTSLHGGGDGKAAGLVLVRVAKPDTDAFRAYGSMIPEFLRLEEMVAKGWVRQ